MRHRLDSGAVGTKRTSAAAAGWHAWGIRAFEAGAKRRRTFAYLAELEQSQWLSADALAARQLASLQELLQRAAATSTYYRESWRALSLQPEGLNSLEAFQSWPVLERETVRSEWARLRSNAPDLKRMAKATGGSTGVPLQFELDSGSYERRMAATFRGYGWAGAAPGTRQLHLWGTSVTPVSSVSKLKSRLYDWLYNRSVLSAFELSDDTTPISFAALNARRPEIIVAYTNALYSFARNLKERGLIPHRPRSIVVGAEKLHSFQRELIEEVFRAPVFETYGSREFMLMAAQCEQRRGLHVTAENLVIEVVDDDGRAVPEGVEGRVVVTDLFNFATPFVRYVNGDRAIAGGRCDCGRGLPLLEEVSGRQVDTLVTPDGRQVSGVFFPHLLKEFPAVRRFQVTQDRLDEVVLRVVAPQADAVDLERITGAVTVALGPSVRFSIERVNDIPLTSSGKLLVVSSRVGGRGRSS